MLTYTAVYAKGLCTKIIHTVTTKVSTFKWHNYSGVDIQGA